ncbi:MAG: bifunctional [glutamate--ammonia ligase]-adenylyl-L-tyrosine phosphorylase/[glutamate--ammonia-ligase] adenylyltransferase [Gammaproteobacteria bacterium]|nr:bifunctional [glutamate--ammonia ligase]-adenylyl-L-tyrosine phosphorylase/[glutamate--ammonia-ligase] adenylyltransferase [Gammaproteobacteria bacterium]
MSTSSHIPALLEDQRQPWLNLCEALRDGDLDPQAWRDLEQLALASPYALRQLGRDPGLARELLALDDFSLDDAIIDLASEDRVDLDQVKSRLRRYRHRKHLAIIFFDVARAATDEDTLRRLSDLADQVIGEALAACNRLLADKHGQPVTQAGEPMLLNVIAMGKLGGRELNFSSDIDLICCFDSDGELAGFGQLSYQEYFTRLVRMLSQVLSENTADGFAYRVDLRLRPWGESGPVVLSHAALEHYYQLHGREWEQYAMVKARLLSGSTADHDYLGSLIRPFVYRRYHDYRVFEGLATLKDKIDVQARARAMRVNIKVGPGGIREIEFFVQAFQILKGGRNHRLQQTGIFDCFDALAEQAIVDAAVIDELRKAYCFLRRLENRIQMYDDQQTHDLPSQPIQQARIAATLDFADWASLLHELQHHRDRVSHHFTELFKRETTSDATVAVGADFSEPPEDDHEWDFIRDSRLESRAEINLRMTEFVRSKAWGFMSTRARQRFNSLLPGLVQSIANGRCHALLFDRFMRLFSSIAGRSVYFELLVQNPVLLDRLTHLFDNSAWIADEVAAYPMLLENLIEDSAQQLPERDALLAQLRARLANVAGDTELELDTLRLFKREMTLVVASAELAGNLDALQASACLSDLAEVVLEAVYDLARASLGETYGEPECSVDGVNRRAEFAIIGYGKLGGRELHYRSDLDVIFLHDSEGEQQYTNGARCIENTMYFARLAQKIISLISVMTPSGKLYEIDSRLRPDGSKGLLVSSLPAYQRYQQEKAWTWEHQALVRARAVAGSKALGERFADIRRSVLQQPRDKTSLAQEIVDMRLRMYRHKQPSEADRIDLKQARGGMVDIEFLVQYEVLSQANNIGSEHLYSDNIRLLGELFRLGLISGSQSQLAEIYQHYHHLLHESVLQNENGEVAAETVAAQLQQVMLCWNDCFGTGED